MSEQFAVVDTLGSGGMGVVGFSCWHLFAMAALLSLQQASWTLPPGVQEAFSRGLVETARSQDSAMLWETLRIAHKGNRKTRLFAAVHLARLGLRVPLVHCSPLLKPQH